MRHAEINKVKDGYYVKISKGYSADILKEAKQIALENGIPKESTTIK